MADTLQQAPAINEPAVGAVVVASSGRQAAVQALVQTTAAGLRPQVGKLVVVADPRSLGASALNAGAGKLMGRGSGLLLPNGHAMTLPQGPPNEITHLLFCQAGVLPGAHAVSIMKRVIDTDEGVGIVGPVTDGPAGLQQVAVVGLHYRTPLGFLLFSDYVAMLHRAAHRPAPRVDGFFLMTTVAAFSALGGFDTRFDPGFYEDDDFCIRLADEMSLLPAIAYGAWVGWPVQQPWLQASDPVAAQAESKRRYEKKWAARSRLTVAGSMPPEKGEAPWKK